MRVIKNHEGERGPEGNGAAVCVGLGSALCQVVQGRCGGPSDLGLCGEGRDAGKRVACVGVAAWDVGHDWMLASASVMALASFGLLPQLLYGSSRCLLSGVRVRAQASRAF